MKYKILKPNKVSLAEDNETNEISITIGELTELHRNGEFKQFIQLDTEAVEYVKNSMLINFPKLWEKDPDGYYYYWKRYKNSFEIDVQWEIERTPYRKKIAKQSFRRARGVDK